MNRALFAALAAGLIALTAALCVTVALAQDEPPLMQRPQFVDRSPSGQQTLWWYEQRLHPRSTLSPCEDRTPLHWFEVRSGTRSAACVNADDRAIWTYLVEGPQRLIVWRSEVLEDYRPRAYLPLVRR